MDKLLCVGALLSLLFTGCATSSQPTPTAQERAAFQAGQQQALMQSQAGPPPIIFWGEVKQRSIPWSEGLTLANAILAAEYTGPWDPHDIFVIRRGQRHAINPKALLRGQEDPLLEPGDIVEIRR